MDQCGPRLDVQAQIAAVEQSLVPPRVLLASPPARASLRDRMAFYGVPGVSLAVFDGFDLKWARAYGVADARSPTPVSTETMFQAGSVSKPVAAAAALRLVQQGRLDLDEDVNRYLVSWKIPSDGAWTPRVSLRHLLSHTGGITRHGIPGILRHHPLPSLLDILEGRLPPGTLPASALYSADNLLPVRVNKIPGAQDHYSSGGFTILQQLLIDVTGLSFPDLMRELVLDPLDMAHSTFEQPLPETWVPQAAAGHLEGGRPVQGSWLLYPASAQGGLWTTPSDLAHFFLALLRAREEMASGSLSQELAREMFTPQLGTRVGLGLLLEGEGDALRFDQAGRNEGFACRVVAFCASGRGAAVMTNWHYGLLIDELIPSLAGVYNWPALVTEGPATKPVDRQLAEEVEGEYALRADFRLRLSRKGSALVLVVPDQPPMELRAASPTRFAAEVVNTEVLIERDEGGSVTALILRQEGTSSRALRVR